MRHVRGIKIMDCPPLTSITGAPVWYSLRARVLGELCGLCDLGLCEYGCSCPPAELLFSVNHRRWTP